MPYGPRAIAKAHEVVLKVAEGSSVKPACIEVGLAVSVFNEVITGVREVALAYSRARELRADLWADEIIQIADTDPDSNRARNRINARQWLASKHNQKVYGERIDLNVSQSISINEALAQAQARLLSVRDQADVIDAEIVEPATLSDGSGTDSQTVAIEKPPQPDIFQ